MFFELFLMIVFFLMFRFLGSWFFKSTNPHKSHILETNMTRQSFILPFLKSNLGSISFPRRVPDVVELYVDAMKFGSERRALWGSAHWIRLAFLGAWLLEMSLILDLLKTKWTIIPKMVPDSKAIKNHQKDKTIKKHQNNIKKLKKTPTKTLKQHQKNTKKTSKKHQKNQKTPKNTKKKWFSLKKKKPAYAVSFAACFPSGFADLGSLAHCAAALRRSVASFNLGALRKIWMALGFWMPWIPWVFWRKQNLKNKKTWSCLLKRSFFS